MTEKELLQLKEEINEAKEESLKLQGQRSALLKQLKDDWDCKTIKEAETKLQKFEMELQNLEEQLSAGLREIDTELNEIL